VNGLQFTMVDDKMFQMLSSSDGKGK